jgi:hypothetical protein
MIPRLTASRTSNFIVSTTDICSTALPDAYACAFTASAVATTSVFSGGGVAGDGDASPDDVAPGLSGPGRSSTLAFLETGEVGGVCEDEDEVAVVVVDVDAALHCRWAN